MKIQLNFMLCNLKLLKRNYIYIIQIELIARNIRFDNRIIFNRINVQLLHV